MAVLPRMCAREEENVHLLHICLADPVCLSYCCTCSASPPPLSLPRPSTDAKPGSSTPFFPWCSSVYQPLVIWEAGFPGGTAQVAVMSLARSASRTICPSFCPHFIYVAAHLVNSRFPATHLLITTCWHSFNLFLEKVFITCDRVAACHLGWREKQAQVALLLALK